MSNTITGVPAGRVSNLFIRDRVINQAQADEVALYNLQMQVSSGHCLNTPSDDPVAASQVMDLQRLVARKKQAQSDLNTNQSFLNATDTALSNVSGMLAEARSTVLGAMGSTTSATQREAAAEQIDQTLTQMLNVANTQYRGRYLFAGSTTGQQPFVQAESGYVQYDGNERRVVSYADINQLVDSNLTGNEVFGAISDPVRGTAALTPAVTYDTRLEDLRGGRGIDLGSIVVSDGAHSKTVDLTGAATIGDIASRIQANPPDGRTLAVELTGNTLTIRLEGSTGDLSIRDAGGGRTAKELGIDRPDGVGNQPIVSNELDPALRSTTALADILGARARAYVHSAAADSGLLVEADDNGAAFNGTALNLVDDPTVTAGNEVVHYDATTKAITVYIDGGHSQARQVVAALNNAHAAGVLPFTARLDLISDRDGGQGFVDAGAGASTAGGSGSDFDRTHGLQIVNHGQTYTVDLSKAATVGDMLNAVEGSGAGMLAEINENHTGINVRSRISGADFTIGENGGTSADQLGLRSMTAQTQLLDLNFAQTRDLFKNDSAGTDFTITTSGGASIAIDVQGMTTVGQLLDKINALGGGTLQARLAAQGNGVELVDTTPGAGPITVSRDPSNDIAVALGLMTEDQSSRTSTAATFTGTDVNPRETASIFTALVRLRDALRSGDDYGVQHGMEVLDAKTTDMNYSRAELGARQQGLVATKSRLDTELVEIQADLSQVYDVDLADVITRMTMREATYEASLRATAQIFQLSLLSFL